MTINGGSPAIRHGTARVIAVAMLAIAACDTAPPTEEPPTEEPPTDQPPILADPCVDLRIDGAPDEYEGDCNGNGVPDDEDLASGFSTDCDSSGVPDELSPRTLPCSSPRKLFCSMS